MAFVIPNKMLITSDDSELELVKTIPASKNKKEITYLYKFSKSFTKENTEFEMTESQIKNNLKNFFKAIE